MAAVQAAAPRVSWAWTWGIFFCLALAQRLLCATVSAQRLCARTNYCSRGLPFLFAFARRRRRIRSAKNSAGPRAATSRGSGLRAKSQSNVPLCLSRRAQETGGGGTGQWVRGPQRRRQATSISLACFGCCCLLVIAGVCYQPAAADSGVISNLFYVIRTGKRRGRR